MHCRETGKWKPTNCQKLEIRTRTKYNPDGYSVINWREGTWNTLGPAGPPLQRGVLVVWQSIQLFFISLNLLAAELFIISSASVLCLFKEKGHSIISSYLQTQMTSYTRDNKAEIKSLLNTHFCLHIHCSQLTAIRKEWSLSPVPRIKCVICKWLQKVHC